MKKQQKNYRRKTKEYISKRKRSGKNEYTSKKLRTHRI